MDYKAEYEALRKENDKLRDEMMRLISRNLDLSERLEEDDNVMPTYRMTHS